MEEDTFKKLNANFKTPSLNSSYTLNSPVLNTEPCVNVSRLKSIYCQNVTSILNNPEFSFIDEVVTKFQRLDTYSGKELKKLSDLSPKSIRCGKRRNKSAIEEKEVNFEEYLNKIEKCYNVFKRNHKKQINPELNSTMTILEDSNINSYRRNSLNIPAEYLSLNYKLNDNLLNLNVEKMFIYSEELTEKCGELDYQMNKLLFNSSKLAKYINDNYELLDKVNFFHEKIEKFKTSNKLLKSKLLLNSLKTINLGCKKSNLNKIQILFGQIKILYDNLALMKEYSEDPTKIQEFFEVQNKSIYIIDLLRNDYSEITVLTLIEKEIEEQLKKVTNRLYGELIQFSMDQLFKSVVYLEYTPKETFNLEIELPVYSEKYEFDLSMFKQSKILQILSFIEFPQITNNFQPKLNEILSYVYRVDVDLGLKIRNLLKKIFNDEMLSSIKNLSDIFIESYSTILNKKIEKDFFNCLEVIDQSLFIFLINNVYKVLYECMDVILYCIQKECINYLKELNVENEQIVEYEGLYSEEMQQIRKICLEDMTKVIEKYLSNNFDSSSVLPINNFLENYQISSNIIHMNSVFNKTTIENSLVQLQECFIFDFFAEKIKEINSAIDNEEWKEINFQSNYQTIVSFMLSPSLQSLKGTQKFEILQEFIKLDSLTSELTEQVIGVSNEKYKIIQSILVIIKLLFDSEKLLIMMDDSYSEIVSQKIIKLIRDYSNKCNYMIVGGEAYKLKKLSINQKNICIKLLKKGAYLSSLMFLNELSVSYCRTISSLIGKNIIGIDGLFNDLKTYIDNGKQKLLDLSLDIISQSFTLVSFDWHKDSSAVLKDKIEKFFNKQKTVLTIYTAITNYLPQTFSLELASFIINNLLQNYKKSLSEMVKIENKNNAKQFRILMEKVKKLIEYFKINDANIYYGIFDDYISNYAPKPAEKEKTTEKNDD